MDADSESGRRRTRSKIKSVEFGGSVFLITSDGRTLSLPIPSRSHRDPLSWSKKKRLGAYFSLIINGIVGLMLIQCPNLLFTALAKEFADQVGEISSSRHYLTTENQDLRPFHLDTITYAQSCFIGLGAIVWIPLSLAIGRRGVLLCSTLVLFASVLWAGFLYTFHQLLIAVSLQGLGEGLSLSAALLMIIDLTFIHQRPHAIGMYWAVVGFLNFGITSLVPRMTNEGTNWRLFYELWSIPVAISGIIIFFLYPETYFRRPAVAFDGRVLIQSATEKVEVYPDWVASPTDKELPEVPYVGWRLKLHELKPWRMIEGGWRACGQCYVQIFHCLFQPLIFWIMMLKCLMFTGLLSMARTYAATLSAPPYRMQIQDVALMNLAAAVGSLCAWPASTLLTNHITKHMTISNQGVRKAEFYLPAIVIPVLALTVSMILFGVTAHQKLHFMCFFVAYFLAGFAFVGILTAVAVWVAEAYPRHAAAALAVTNGVSYLCSFGLSFTILPWIQKEGIAGADIQLALIVFFVGCIGVPIAFWGKRVRQTLTGNWAKNEGGALRPQSERRHA